MKVVILAGGRGNERMAGMMPIPPNTKLRSRDLTPNTRG